MNIIYFINKKLNIVNIDFFLKIKINNGCR